ncbi:hypothetical protein DICVIV_02707 [Dictyocaulus viviparus]|uniref:Armadillo/beta-catenin-like repeat protein n=1 Tax=Dictyocaulus viviparus TaxID=29172 RepID=A0A0D8Y4M6_DICVI|nr:hypothetical protein DICVIV_02707 [Dictyocaulus viviparus]
MSLFNKKLLHSSAINLIDLGSIFVIMGDSDQNKVTSTLKSYLKLCANPSHRPVILKVADHGILHILRSLLEDERVAVMTYLVKIFLHLTENGEDAAILSSVPGIEENLSCAAEKSFPPNIIYNILILVSRLRTARDRVTNNKAVAGTTNSAAENKILESGDNMIPVSRRFVSRKSKQLVYEFDELHEDLKKEIERRMLAQKGVISVYFSLATNRVTIRTVLTADATEITDLLFDCGCEMVTQIVKVDGVDEFFKMYASEREKKAIFIWKKVYTYINIFHSVIALQVVKLPDYLDDIEPLDPSSCVATTDYIGGRKEGGWFSTLSTFVKSSLW